METGLSYVRRSIASFFQISSSNSSSPNGSCGSNAKSRSTVLVVSASPSNSVQSIASTILDEPAIPAVASTTVAVASTTVAVASTAVAAITADAHVKVENIGEASSAAETACVEVENIGEASPAAEAACVEVENIGEASPAAEAACEMRKASPAATSTCEMPVATAAAACGEIGETTPVATSEVACGETGEASRLAQWRALRAGRNSVDRRQSLASPSKRCRSSMDDASRDTRRRRLSMESTLTQRKAESENAKQIDLDRGSAIVHSAQSQRVSNFPKGSEPKVYEELIDVDALRWYAQSEKDAQQSQVEELLAAIEATNTGSSIQRVSVTYHRGKSGHRVADKLSLQTVSRECRSAASGSLLCEIDISSNYPMLLVQMVDKCLRQSGKPALKLVALRYCAKAQDEILSTIIRRYGVSHLAAKSLVLRLLHGGTLCAWRGEVGARADALDVPILFDIQKEAAQVAKVLESGESRKSNASPRSAPQRPVAYILAEAQDAIVRVCEDVLERDDLSVSTILPDGFLLDMRAASCEELVQLLRRARSSIKSTLGYSVHFERKLLVGCAMQARITRLGGSPSDIALAAEHDAEIARLKQDQFTTMYAKKDANVVKCVKARQSGAEVVPWTAEEKRLFADAMQKQRISDPSFWDRVSVSVGRSTLECKDYYNAQQASQPSCTKKPKKEMRPLPKTDCALRMKSVREHVKEGNREAGTSKTAIADCFQPSEMCVTMEGLEGLETLDATPRSNVTMADNTPTGRASLASAMSDVEGEEPHNVHRYIHSVIRRSQDVKKLNNKMGTRGNATPIGQTATRWGIRVRCRDAMQRILRERDSKEDHEFEKDNFGSDAESDTEDF